MESRALDGGAVRRVQLQVEGLEPPSPRTPEGAFLFPVRQIEDLRIRDGRLFVTGSWKTLASGATDGSAETISTEGLSVVYDASTGRVLRQERPLRPLPVGSSSPSPARYGLAWGAPATRAPFLGPAYGYGGVLSDPWTLAPFGSVATVVAGQYGLRWSPDQSPSMAPEARNGWSRNGGTIAVSDMVTGKARYQVKARPVRQASTSSHSARASTSWLMPLAPDGSLRITVERTRGAGLKVVGVDSEGRIRRLTPTLRRATRVSSVVGYGRAFSYVFGFRKSGGKARACEGVWVTDRAGRRGRKLDLRAFARRTGAIDVPVWWDGRYAVWVGFTEQYRVVVHAQDLHGLRLRRSERPSCRL